MRAQKTVLMRSTADVYVHLHSHPLRDHFISRWDPFDASLDVIGKEGPPGLWWHLCNVQHIWTSSYCLCSWAMITSSHRGSSWILMWPLFTHFVTDFCFPVINYIIQSAIFNIVSILLDYSRAFTVFSFVSLCISFFGLLQTITYFFVLPKL